MLVAFIFIKAWLKIMSTKTATSATDIKLIQQKSPVEWK